VDVDSDLHILAKANMLLHLAEALREASTTVPALNTAMADTFVLMNSNETLGSLEHPPLGSVDVILTNPPYVTEGSGIYRKEIAEIQGLRNGLDLRDYYEGSGLGLESMFMRYIAGALKEGGRAFIVVPLGLLNRTAVGPKARLLAECNIVASIQLPRNAFFNTPQQAYILVLEKRFSLVDPRPPVFCALSRSIGETLDYQRVPTPDDNDLADVAEAFVAFANGDPALAEASPVIKIVAATEFSRDDRWDVMRFWEDEELVQLGEKAAAITRVEFVEEARQSLEQIAADFDAARAELDALTAVPTKLVDLSDDQLFVVRSGTRITNATVRENPGAVPVYSCFTNQHAKKGDISADWLDEQGIPIEDKTIVTVMANGAKAVGKVFVREPGCVITDDVIAVEVIHPDLDLEYVAEALRGAIARGGFLYEAKLFVRRVKELSIEVPVDQSGAFDIEQQRVIASAVKRFDSIRDRLGELGNWSSTARIR
jgi:hypothetical protein